MLIIKIPHCKLKIETTELNLINSIFRGKLNEFQEKKRIGRIQYWWIEIENQNIKRKIGFDIFKKPVKNSNLYSIDINDISDYLLMEKVEMEHFNDVYNLMNISDFDSLQKVHDKYRNLWRKNESSTVPVFPILSLDIEVPDDSIEKYDELNEIILNPDIIGYDWGESEKIIDSMGNLYVLEYLNFGYPMGVVIPKQIERKISNTELENIIRIHDIEFSII